MSKDVILTGLRANNDLHIGNYVGAIVPIVEMAKTRSKDFQINLFVPDLHSFTTPIDHKTLQAGVLNNVRTYLAAGLPATVEGIAVYRQSYISAHSELTWILDCFTGFGEMSRMTQFKDKSAKSTAERVSVGLFNYPVLMAADILLYNGRYVPVGDDQTQHLEFTRDIALRMNTQFGELFTVPEPVAKQHAFFGNDHGLRIKDLSDPSKKMSKSDETGKGVIFMNEDPALARKKIMSAVTDDKDEIRYEPKSQPGVSNLLELLALFSGKSIDAVVTEYGGQTMYGPLKQAVADVICAFLDDFQKKYSTITDDQVFSLLTRSETQVGKQAADTLLSVQKAVGLR